MRTDTPPGTFPDQNLGITNEHTLRANYIARNSKYFKNASNRFDLFRSEGDFNTFLFGREAVARFAQFCEWALNTFAHDVIVAGHSGWLLKFIRSRLPPNRRSRLLRITSWGTAV